MNANRLSIRGNGVTSTFESDITTIESIQPFAAKYRFNQYQTQGFCDIVRLMHDRWWSNYSRFIKNIVKSCQVNRSHPRPLADLTPHCLQWKDPDLPCIGFKKKGEPADEGKLK